MKKKKNEEKKTEKKTRGENNKILYLQSVVFGLNGRKSPALSAAEEGLRIDTGCVTILGLL